MGRKPDVARRRDPSPDAKGWARDRPRGAFRMAKKKPDPNTATITTNDDAGTATRAGGESLPQLW
jgi:hypothetical protein